MSKKGLSRDLIITEALDMIDKNSLKSFSIRKLAEKLNVQVSSLYNYIRNEDDLLLEVVLRAVDMYTDSTDRVIAERGIDNFALADAFRSFFVEHPNLYEILTDPRWSSAPEFRFKNEKFFRPIYQILREYGIEDENTLVHLTRMIRVITHGFCSLEISKGFEEFDVPPVESYYFMVKAMELVMENCKESEKNEK